MTLTEAFRVALQSSDDLSTAEAGLKRAEAGRRRAVAALLPRLSVQGTYTLNDEEVRAGSSIVINQQALAGSATVSMTLLDARSIPGFMVTEHRIDAAALRLKDTQQATLLAVAQAYYTVLAAQKMVSVAERALASRVQHLAAAVARLEAGDGILVDVERARAAKLRAERDVIEARHQATDGADGLAIAMGIAPPLARSLIAPARAPSAPPSEPEAMARASSRRSDLLALQESLAAAERTKLATWLTFLPTVSLNGTVNVSPESFRNPDGVNMVLTLALNWTLYDGGMRYAQLDEDEAMIAEARASLRRQSRRVRAEVRRALRDMSRASATTRATKAERSAAKRALDAAQSAFREGQGTGLMVLDAQLAMEQASAAHVREQLAYDTAAVALRRALGDLRP